MTQERVGVAGVVAALSATDDARGGLDWSKRSAGRVDAGLRGPLTAGPFGHDERALMPGAGPRL